MWSPQYRRVCNAMVYNNVLQIHTSLSTRNTHTSRHTRQRGEPASYTNATDSPFRYCFVSFVCFSRWRWAFVAVHCVYLDGVDTVCEPRSNALHLAFGYCLCVATHSEWIGSAPSHWAVPICRHRLSTFVCVRSMLVRVWIASCERHNGNIFLICLSTHSIYMIRRSNFYFFRFLPSFVGCSRIDKDK